MSDEKHYKTIPHPLGNNIKFAGHHWLEGFNLVGHSCGLYALQWGPSSKCWYRSGELDTCLGDISKTLSFVCSWKYVSVIHQPDLADYDWSKNKTITREEPVPPGHRIRQTGHHWIANLSEDGFPREIVLLQWNPNVKEWNHSNHVGTGIKYNCHGDVYLKECPLPTI
jgi:hypothetical protein